MTDSPQSAAHKFNAGQPLRASLEIRARGWRARIPSQPGTFVARGLAARGRPKIFRKYFWKLVGSCRSSDRHTPDCPEKVYYNNTRVLFCNSPKR